MRQTDGRKLDHKTLEALRIRAVQRVMEGESPEVVIKALGMSRARIYEWLALHREGGFEALKAKPIPGRPSKLNGQQIRELYTWITTFTPDQLKFGFALWTRARVRELIRREFKVRLSDVSVGRLLRNLGLTPQKPLHRAYQQKPEAVAQWKQETYPEIRKEAKKVGATIYFGDEATIRSDYHSGTTWAPMGNTPVVRSTGSRFGINLISAISPRGELRFKTIQGTMNTDTFLEFLKALIHDAANPVFLILDNHPVHHAKRVRAYVESLNGMLKLFFLPAYSPELNPDESVWGYIKYHHVGKQVINNKEQLKEIVYRQLRRLQKLPALLKSFFRHPDLAYILN
jgi:transposase